MKLKDIKLFSPVYTDTGSVETYYSASRCDTCHSELGGMRYSIDAIDKHDNRDTLEVCTDCYHKLND